jgi:hypothetical protein
MKWVKHSIILLALYIAGMVLFIQNSENLLSEIFKLRQNYLVEKKVPTTSFVFSTQEWQKIQNKKEIKLKDVYYDIIKVSLSPKKVTAEVIEDKNESFIKFITHTFHKKEKNKSKGNKLKLKRNLIVTFEAAANNKVIANKYLALKQNYCFQQKKYSTTLNSLMKPPIFYRLFSTYYLSLV